MNDESSVVGSIRAEPTTTDEAAEAERPATILVPPQLPWRHRMQNRIRMAVCNWFGITYALQQMGLRIGGNRADLEHLAGTLSHNAKLLNSVVVQLNRNTKLLGVFQQYPMLGKLAAEARAREAAKEGKVIANGDDEDIMPGIVLDSKGNQRKAENN